MKVVTKVAMAVDSPVVIAGIEADENVLKHSEDDDAGEVMVITQALSPTKVEVMLVFPTPAVGNDECEEDERKYNPTAISFDLNTFLNAARMIAMHHGAVIKQPEAMTDENVLPKIIRPGR